MARRYVSGLGGDPQVGSGAGLPGGGTFTPAAPPPTQTPATTPMNPWDASGVTGYYPTSFDIPTMLTNANLIARHSSGAPGANDLSYWENVRGSNPGISPAYLYARMLGYEAGGADMAPYGPFAQGGPGWGGYQAGAPAPQTSPTPAAGATGSMIPSNVAGAIQQINPSVWTTPYSASPGALSIPSFNFTPPTEAEAAAYPGYQFSRDQALLAMQNSAAEKGLLNSGGTIFDLGSLANSLASQNYGQLWNQKYQAAGANFQNPLLAEQTAYNQYAQNANDTWSKVYQAMTA